jgi:hypothetical protein
LHGREKQSIMTNPEHMYYSYGTSSASICNSKAPPTSETTIFPNKKTATLASWLPLPNL